MKKQHIILFILYALISACSGNETSANNSEKEAVTQKTAGMSGKELIAQSDCSGCHHEKSKLVGPSYLEIAQKYQSTDNTISMLADKIIKGGSGNWGQIPMTAHAQITLPDAEAMVKYILTLKSGE